ncbi:MetQ/NlpA family ABC transporter substrate-binding protein [Vagococcus vulneris]|uniref:Lipoprotein n=1 Tax=Vagococcus vulneris TaxID=1977869 RepID=A0A429ZZ45_9ENTE|nr:MetQ/NlpA family ABC transporter substrate-binding protein [Vagococcus vulneris]RST99282.1 metal ABC transporter substrate-binding protein [Vagococcus vulneris]
MKQIKKFIGISLLIGTLALAVGCGNKNQEKSSTTTDKGSSKTIKEATIGVAPGPYGDMVTEAISPLTEKEGFKLKTKVFNDYVQPNKALDAGQIDANLFQHTAYLEKFSKDNNLNLSVVQQVPTLGMGAYSKKIKSKDDIKDKATIAVANDPSNLARTLKLLTDEKLITLKENVDETKATINDIDKNPHDFTFKTLDAAQLSRSLDTVDVALIPGNFSWAAKLDPADALFLEKLQEKYQNVVVVKESEQSSDLAKTLKKVLDGPEFRKAIKKSKFKDFTKPAFWSK